MLLDLNLHRSLGFVFIIACLATACEKVQKPPSDNRTVSVKGQYDSPVRNALIHGGYDWTDFSVETNAYGLAALPAYAFGQVAMIDATNYFPLEVGSLESRTYRLSPTEYSMLKWGEAEGRGIYFDGSILTTIVYQGSYNVYSVSDYHISLMDIWDFPSTAKSPRIIGDTLWVSVHSDSLYAFSIQEPTVPQQILALEIGGYLYAFTIDGNVIAFADPFNRGPVRIFRYSFDGEAQELSQIGEIQSRQIEFIEGNLVVLGSTDAGLTILTINLVDPTNPQILNRLDYPGLSYGILYEHLAIIQDVIDENSSVYSYFVIDLSDPVFPQPISVFNAPGYSFEMVGADLAVVKYKGSALSAILAGDPISGFSTRATFRGMSMFSQKGFFPPYFIFSGSFWKLEMEHPER